MKESEIITQIEEILQGNGVPSAKVTLGEPAKPSSSTDEVSFTIEASQSPVIGIVVAQQDSANLTNIMNHAGAEVSVSSSFEQQQIVSCRVKKVVKLPKID